MMISNQEISDLVIHQLHNYWINIDDTSITSSVPEAMQLIEMNYRGLPGSRYYRNDTVQFSPYVSVQWMNFLYRLSRVLWKKGYGETADQVYYLNKIMHSVDWLYAVELPIHFLCEHPLGSVLGRAQYGDYFFVYQGTTVGGNRRKGVLSYPRIGNNVILFANASVLGDVTIGNNVVLSAGVRIINESIPDNCIVFGETPNLVIKHKSEEDIKEYTKHIWEWDKIR